ncbi:MAG: hypothetical protein AB1925_07095 [Actinomycetota bacterium]
MFTFRTLVAAGDTRRGDVSTIVENSVIVSSARGWSSRGCGDPPGTGAPAPRRAARAITDGDGDRTGADSIEQLACPPAEFIGAAVECVRRRMQAAGGFGTRGRRYDADLTIQKRHIGRRNKELGVTSRRQLRAMDV